jgi:hypothetical protein
VFHRDKGTHRSVPPKCGSPKIAIAQDSLAWKSPNAHRVPRGFRSSVFQRAYSQRHILNIVMDDMTTHAGLRNLGPLTWGSHRLGTQLGHYSPLPIARL